MFKLLDKCLELSYESVLLSEVVYFNTGVDSVRDININLLDDCFSITAFNLLYAIFRISRYEITYNTMYMCVNNIYYAFDPIAIYKLINAIIKKYNTPIYG